MPENINTLAVGYEDHSIKIWDLRALGKVGKFKDATTTSYDSVKSLCFSSLEAHPKVSWGYNNERHQHSTTHKHKNRLEGGF